jgi:hypothetical protein
MSDQNPPMTESDATPMHVLEPHVPLAQSMVWRLQRTFYGDQGIAAWSRSHVPQAVTTSPIIARAYARVVLGFWRDMQADLDPTQPLYIVELGAGSGRFAYRFLKALTALLQNVAEPKRPRFVYVMTDASPPIVEFWRSNPRLHAFVDAGVLDFANFDLVALAPPTLVNSGTTLRVGEVANPIAVIGNYIFDSIPQDAITIKYGQMFASLVSVGASTPDLDLRAPDSTVKISVSFATDEVAIASDAEPDPVLRHILDGYRQRLDDTTLLIPRAAMAGIRYFRELAGGRALWLIGDFGDTREEDLQGHGPPGFGAGGGLWLPVNFHALGEYARGTGGRARHPRHRHVTLNISMLLFGVAGAASSEAELAYEDTIDQHGPDELSMLARALAEHLPKLKLDAVLAVLRTTGWDSDYVVRFVPFLIEALPEASERFRQEIRHGIQQAWDQYYPIGEPDDLPFGLGVLLHALELYPEALEFFERSLEEFGEDPRTTLNMALTLYRLNRLPETLNWLDRTLALDPTNEYAGAMRPSVAAEIAEGN